MKPVLREAYDLAGWLVVSLAIGLVVASFCHGRPPQCTLPPAVKQCTLPPLQKKGPCGKAGCDCGCNEGAPCDCDKAKAPKAGKVNPKVSRKSVSSGRKNCPCSASCTCGCNEGAGCDCNTLRKTSFNYLPAAPCCVTGVGEPCGSRAVPLACGSPWSVGQGCIGTCSPVTPTRLLMPQASMMPVAGPTFMPMGGGFGGGGFGGSFGGGGFGGGFRGGFSGGGGGSC